MRIPIVWGKRGREGGGSATARGTYSSVSVARVGIILRLVNAIRLTMYSYKRNKLRQAQ